MSTKKKNKIALTTDLAAKLRTVSSGEVSIIQKSHEYCLTGSKRDQEKKSCEAPEHYFMVDKKRYNAYPYERPQPKSLKEVNALYSE